MSDAIALEKLVGPAATHLDINPVTLRLVPIATGNHNSSFWVAAEPRRRVLRIAPQTPQAYYFTNVG